MKNAAIRVYWIKRIAVYIFGVIVMSVGIALSIRAEIGVAPGSVITYAASILTPLTVGWCTTIFHFICIFIQAMMKKRFTVGLIVQLPLAFVFGQFIDFCLWLLPVSPANLLWGVAMLCAGIVIFSLGIRAITGSDLFLMPSDNLARETGLRLGWSFPKAKLVFDVGFIVIVVAAMLAFSKDVFLVIGLGTVICAVVTGPVIGIYTRLFPFFDVVRPENQLNTDGKSDKIISRKGGDKAEKSV